MTDRPANRSLLPVGIERTLYAAALDPALRDELLTQRAAALARLSLRPEERATLQHIPAAQLGAAIDAVDLSPENLARRGFLRAVATATAGVVALHGLSGCSDDTTVKGIRPDVPDGGPADGAQEASPVADGLPAPTGIRPG